MGKLYLRKYGVETTIDFSLYEADGVDFRTDAVYASGDVKIMKDEGAEANTTNGFTDEGTGYSLVLTATEMQAARIQGYVVDQTATKVWLDDDFIIETYGHASAMHAFDLDDSVRGGMTALPNAAADAAGGLPISDAGGLDLDSVLSGNTPQTGDSFARIGAAGASLTDLGGMSTGMKVEVNAEVVDALNTDTYAEPGQGAPGATISLAQKISYLYKAWRNKKDNDGSTSQLYDDAGTTVDQKQTTSESGGTVTKGEWTTGP